MIPTDPNAVHAKFTAIRARAEARVDAELAAIEPESRDRATDAWNPSGKPREVLIGRVARAVQAARKARGTPRA